MSHAVAAHARPVTADELLRIPNDGLRRELIDGEVQVMTPARYRHGIAAMRIGGPLDQYARAQGLGEVPAAETGFLVSANPDTVLAPDVAFVRQERLEEFRQADGFGPGAPDFVVEVVSPRDSFGAVQAKVFKWLAAGCSMVVIIDPERRSGAVYRSRNDVLLLTESDELDGGDVVPGWRLPLREVFD